MQPSGPGPHEGRQDGPRRASEQTDQAANERERIADQREGIADERELAADQRERIADQREGIADQREGIADQRELAADEREARLEELLRVNGLELNDLQQRAAEAIARSNAQIARAQAKIDRDAVVIHRDQAATKRELAKAQRVHDVISHRQREAIAHAHAAIEQARILRSQRRPPEQGEFPRPEEPPRGAAGAGTVTGPTPSQLQAPKDLGPTAGRQTPLPDGPG